MNYRLAPAVGAASFRSLQVFLNGLHNEYFKDIDQNAPESILSDFRGWGMLGTRRSGSSLYRVLASRQYASFSKNCRNGTVAEGRRLHCHEVRQYVRAGFDPLESSCEAHGEGRSMIL